MPRYTPASMFQPYVVGSQYIPMDLDWMKQNLKQRGELGTKAAEEQAKAMVEFGKLKFADQATRDWKMKEFKDRLVKTAEKYGDLAMASPDITYEIGAEATHPVYNLNQLQQDKIKEYQDLKSKYGNKFVGFSNDPSTWKLREFNKDKNDYTYADPSSWKLDVGEREDTAKYVDEKYKDIKADLITSGILPQNYMTLTREQFRGITGDKLKALITDRDIQQFKEANPIYTRELKELKGVKDVDSHIKDLIYDRVENKIFTEKDYKDREDPRPDYNLKLAHLKLAEDEHKMKKKAKENEEEMRKYMLPTRVGKVTEDSGTKAISNYKDLMTDKENYDSKGNFVGQRKFNFDVSKGLFGVIGEAVKYISSDESEYNELQEKYKDKFLELKANGKSDKAAVDEILRNVQSDAMKTPVTFGYTDLKENDNFKTSVLTNVFSNATTQGLKFKELDANLVPTGDEVDATTVNNEVKNETGEISTNSQIQLTPWTSDNNARMIVTDKNGKNYEVPREAMVEGARQYFNIYEAFGNATESDNANETTILPNLSVPGTFYYLHKGNHAVYYLDPNGELIYNSDGTPKEDSPEKIRFVLENKIRSFYN